MGGLHTNSIGRRFSSLGRGARRAARAELAFEDSSVECESRGPNATTTRGLYGTSAASRGWALEICQVPLRIFSWGGTGACAGTPNASARGDARHHPPRAPTPPLDWARRAPLGESRRARSPARRPATPPKKAPQRRGRIAPVEMQPGAVGSGGRETGSILEIVHRAGARGLSQRRWLTLRGRRVTSEMARRTPLRLLLGRRDTQARRSSTE